MLHTIKKCHNNLRDSIGLINAAGLLVLMHGFVHWACADVARFLAFFLIATLSSTLKVRLPGITGTMSVSFLFLLIGIVELSLAETLLTGCTGAAVQCVWRAQKRPSAVQVAFNIANMAIATMISYEAYQWLAGLQGEPSLAGPLLLAASAYFVTNTVPVAAAISLTEGKQVTKIWRECYFWSFPYYLVGAGVAGAVSVAINYVGMEIALLVLPVVYLIYRSYHQYLERLEDEKNHATEMADLHLRTIEALVLAIEAKDQTTHDHLRRVQVFAVEVGKGLGLEDQQLDSLRAAAVLHDIGKLAAPEHIISKPGKLSPEEFDKMKIHPVVGAEILERVKFPYPVVPIVRSHHEKWDGSGYPDGLKGEEIPIGARILSAVDCLDAVASDRQYRRALPLEQAMQVVVSESGKSYDPKVVEVLQLRYAELDERLRAEGMKEAPLSVDVKVERGKAPAVGFQEHEAAEPQPGDMPLDFLSSIAAARQEVQMLFELTQDLGNSLSLDETLSVLAVRLKRMVPHDTAAIYTIRGDMLQPAYVSGDEFRTFSSLQIPLGEGLSGWVAANGKWILNGNPTVEPGYTREGPRGLRSALAVPLEGSDGVVGVLALYHKDPDAFTRDHLRVLLAVSYKIALAVENALKYRQAESSATTDYLTGLPNARSLFLHLDSELARSKRENRPIAVLVCDLDGFKQVNDQFGHLEGNEILRAVARGLNDICREYDYVARMGGDEFVVVMPGLKPEAIIEKILRLRHVATRAGREICKVDFLSMSVGQACFPEDGTDAEELLSQADRRMYKNKRGQKAEAEAQSGLVHSHAGRHGVTVH